MRNLVLIIIGCLALLLPLLPSEASTSPVVLVDGTILATDVTPLIQEGRVLIPLRAIFDALDASVDWNPSTSTVEARRQG